MNGTEAPRLLKRSSPQPGPLRRPTVSFAVRVGLIAATIALAVVTVGTVSLTPRVDQSFFFGEDDPQLEEDRKIYQIFPYQSQIIVNVVGDLTSAAYLRRVAALTEALVRHPEVLSAKSLTHGPEDLEDAFESAFWRRLLVGPGETSSNILVVLASDDSPRAIAKIESTVDASHAPGFEPIVAGVPYMIEAIRRRLLEDLRVFTGSAVAVFGIVLFFVFRSPSIVIGSLTASAAAACLTLLASDALGIEIGILTANLVTLVFVLTIPHLVYLTYNWRQAVEERDGSRAGLALVPIGLLGLVGLLRAPLDIISAPAANLALGMGIDDTMIHMTERWRMLRREGKAAREAWTRTRQELWRPIIVSMSVVALGFSIYLLSQFPPTRRFGLWVVLGTLLVLPCALYFLPAVAAWRAPDERRSDGSAARR